MLKEELEKKLGVRVSKTFFDEANKEYLEGDYRNNIEFCEQLRKRKLLMKALEELETCSSCLWSMVITTQKELLVYKTNCKLLKATLKSFLPF